MMKFESVKSNPSAAYNAPDDLVEDPDLSTDEKRALLRQWEYDAREKQVAAEENMDGGAPSLLSRILRARQALDDLSRGGGSAAMKQGGG